jgi:hypothetical protein
MLDSEKFALGFSLGRRALPGVALLPVAPSPLALPLVPVLVLTASPFHVSVPLVDIVESWLAAHAPYDPLPLAGVDGLPPSAVFLPGWNQLPV